MSTLAPRAVTVTRPTELESLLAAHGTRGQARFFLESRGQALEPLEALHAVERQALETVLSAIPTEWRRVHVPRADLDRFLFEPQDIILAVGRDGLVANVAKYLDGQPVIGINPGMYDGVLAPHAPSSANELMKRAAHEELPLESRTLVCARTSDGQSLCALNEIYVGHRTHQSARYTIEAHGVTERQSSSGLIVASGTGASGWARSISRVLREPPALPAPCVPSLVFLVREAWPSGLTEADLTAGVLGVDDALSVTSEMNEDGVIFGDGVESDHIALPYGQSVRLSVAPRALSLCLEA